ncbi:hypothetical protein [Vibrio diazotrophicus]|uniref:hypothetical protein n=1 Tax=Vibrio diazotrophicus TaxID=685 RepID=UPI000C9E0001|nr:hypothetical protein [Vibrio diazotrophicus]PNH98904.1 hypothetical protein C1O24_02385 [Vibrio diazotrophicus]
MNRWFQQQLWKIGQFTYYLIPHRHWLYLWAIATISLWYFNFSQGEIKDSQQWMWLDILGEGSMTLFISIWLVVILACREAGRVTQFLALGLLGVYISCLQDLLDEFYELGDAAYYWDSLVESLPIGVIFLTIGWMGWYREQSQLRQYLLQRRHQFQNSSKLHMDSFLPRFDQLQAFMNSQPDEFLSGEIMGFILDESEVKDAAQLKVLRRRFADLMMLNLPESTQLYHLSGEHYVLFMPHRDIFSIKCERLLMQHLRSAQIYSDSGLLPITFGVTLTRREHCKSCNNNNLSSYIRDLFNAHQRTERAAELKTQNQEIPLG